MIWNIIRKIMSIFKISLPGVDVHNSRIDQDVLNSLYPNPKINVLAQPPHAGVIFVDWVSTTITVPSGSPKTIYSFPHGYNYIPTALGTFDFDDGTVKGKGVLPLTVTIGTVVSQIEIETDSKNVNVKIYTDGSGAVPAFKIKIRFYVFAERGYE